jgi:putative type I restriction modification system methylase
MYKSIDELVERIDERNSDGKISTLIGVSIDKCFINSVANINGTDLTKYKIIRRDDFAVSLMQVSRDSKIPIARLKDYDQAIMSPAYPIFRVRDTSVILPEYLEMWFMRPEFDREAAFIAVGGVRGSMPWEEFAKMRLPVPSLEKQHQVVRAYQIVADRIAIKRRINDNLEAVLAASHSKMFFSMDTSEHSKLGELMTFGNGKSRPKTDGPIPVYGGNGVLSYTDHHNIENAVLIGRVGAYCGSVYLEQGICWVSDNAIFAKSKITKDEFFDYFLLKRLNLFNHHVGTGQQLLTQEILNNIEVPKPVTEQIELFNRKAASVFETIFTNSREIIRLQELSDLLLSRLAG